MEIVPAASGTAAKATNIVATANAARTAGAIIIEASGSRRSVVNLLLYLRKPLPRPFVLAAKSNIKRPQRNVAACSKVLSVLLAQ
jgi:hypothetical protein